VVKPVVWTQVVLAPDAMARLESVAGVVLDASLDRLPGARVAIIGRAHVDATFLDRAGPSLQMVVRHGIGYDGVDVPVCTAAGVLAANTPDGPTQSTAEHAVALLLALAKQLQRAGASMRASEPPTRLELQGIDLRGRTLGVVGFGRIGRRVGEICAVGLGMRVLVHDPFAVDIAAAGPWAEEAASLDELLARSDVVTLHTSLTPATTHLIGERQLRLMRPGSYLINVSRGPVVDEAALIRALHDGHLAGAGLDVFDPEPPDPTNPLLWMTQVVATPHVASNTAEGIARMSNAVVDQIIQLFAGERPTSLIDPAAWPGRAGAGLSEGRESQAG
jgi:phosphoglycerate dehydrogenase-like enzyme